MRSDPNYLKSYLLEHSGINALSSHSIQFPLPEARELQIIPAILLRHPIDRIGSVYAFEKRQKVETPGAKKAKTLSFKEFVLWQLELPHGNMSNFQLRFLLDKKEKASRELQGKHLKTALDRFKACTLSGTVECYNESMILFEESLRKYYSAIDLSYVQQNITPGRSHNLQERLSRIQDQLGTDLYDTLLSHNEWDRRLYNAAAEIIQQKIASKRDFAGSLKDFNARCSKLQGKSISGLLRSLASFTKK
jgi:hypothetical protein